jgi:hypothetical protein
LADEEDIGRELILSLDERQRAVALIAGVTPRDIVPPRQRVRRGGVAPAVVVHGGKELAG